MGTTASQAETTASAEGNGDLRGQREGLITAYNEARELMLAAKTREEAATTEKAKEKAHKEAMSLSAQMANRSKEIRQAEANMAEEGVSFDEWSKPASGKRGNRTTAPVLTQQEIEANIAKSFRVLSGSFPETTKDTCDRRITALLKQAQKHGYSVKDPRKTGKNSK